MTLQQAIDLLHLGRVRVTEMDGISEDHWTAWLSHRRQMRADFDAVIREGRPPRVRRRAELRYADVWTPRIRREALEAVHRQD